MSRYREWDLSCKVYVGNLGSNASKHEIEAAFSKYGPLRNVWVARNPPGFAFVEFEDPRDAEDSVRVDVAEQEYVWKCLQVAVAVAVAVVGEEEEDQDGIQGHGLQEDVRSLVHAPGVVIDVPDLTLVEDKK
ncbi:hypothetical protein RUM43_013880 [Polyplax serrata]|uniref:RRM domain-containing protein n=1 Tax=Polyplax serrata TaxID=468196 RepID=A0AAN8PIS1_POLSC